MTDDEIVLALSAALVAHPAWPEPRRVNIFALSEDDAGLALRESFGPEAQVLAFAFRSDVLASLQAVGGRRGFWISGASGVEMFAECESSEQARAMFAASMGSDALACVSVDLVLWELSRMDEAINGVDPSPLASRAFLSQVAGHGGSAAAD